MGKFKVRYLVVKGKKRPRFYWQPSKTLREADWPPRRLAERTNDIVDAITEAEKLNAELDAWYAGGVKVAAPPGSLPWLIRMYQQDARFTDLTPDVQKVYGYRLKTIEAWSERFGHPPAATLTRKDVKAFAKSRADKPEAAKSTIGLLRVLFGFAIDEGELQSNPATNMRMKSNPPRHQVWTEQQIDAVIAKAEEMGRPSIGLAVALAHNLGQREGDILHMTWGQFDGTKIRLKQRKTGALLEVDCTRQLLDVLAATLRTGTLMVIREETTNPHNGRRFPPRAYRADTFRGEFRLMAKAASIPDDLEFRDLRRTAVVRLAEAGCSVPEIAAISGHSIGVTTKIMDVYCPRTSVMAGHAITKLEEYRKRNTPATKLDA